MNIRKIILLLLLFSITGCYNEKISFKKIITEQIERYPLIEIQDLYKLSYQAAMGHVHLGVDSTMLHNYLISELENIDTSYMEALTEEISPDGFVVRLNLRPFKVSNGDHNKLFKAIFNSSKVFQPSKDNLERYWKFIEEMASEGLLPYKLENLKSFMNKMRSQNYPTVHHSDSYRNHYKPAYRVLIKPYLNQSY